MKALVLVQSTTVGTYINVFAAICLKYKTIKQIRLLDITDEPSSVSIKDRKITRFTSMPQMFFGIQTPVEKSYCEPT